MYATLPRLFFSCCPRDFGVRLCRLGMMHLPGEYAGFKIQQCFVLRTLNFRALPPRRRIKHELRMLPSLPCTARDPAPRLFCSPPSHQQKIVSRVSIGLWATGGDPGDVCVL